MDKPNKTIKNVKLLDNRGRKISRKIRKDEKGLYIIARGMIGRLVKQVETKDYGRFHVITVTRRVDYYVSK